MFSDDFLTFLVGAIVSCRSWSRGQDNGGPVRSIRRLMRPGDGDIQPTDAKVDGGGWGVDAAERHRLG